MWSQTAIFSKLDLRDGPPCLTRTHQHRLCKSSCLVMKAINPSRSHPLQLFGHSKLTSPGEIAKYAVSGQLLNIFLDSFLRSSRSFLYASPSFFSFMLCHLHHTVQGSDPCKDVPGLPLIKSFVCCTVSSLLQSTSFVILKTLTSSNSFANEA